MDSKSVKQPLTIGGVMFNIINYAILIAFTFLCVYPFYYLIINTISSNEISAAGGVMFLPRQIQFQNYTQVMQLPNMARSTIVSVSRTVIGTSLTVLASAFVGFLFTKDMWGRKFWYRFLIASMYFQAGLIPVFLTIVRLGLMDSFLVYVIPSMVQPFSILMVKTFIESTPSSLQESAEIDGAGTMRTFIQIVLPLIKPILATVAIWAAVGQWNSFMDTVLYITDERLHTLQFTLHRFVSQADLIARMMREAAAAGGGAALRAATQTPASVRMTVTVVVTLPILFVYPFFQKYFVKGIMIGAVKG